jgi:hypothetical protein
MGVGVEGSWVGRLRLAVGRKTVSWLRKVVESNWRRGLKRLRIRWWRWSETLQLQTIDRWANLEAEVGEQLMMFRKVRGPLMVQ